MKKLQSILIVEKNGKIIDLERFTCKKYQTVLNQYKRFFLKNPNNHLLNYGFNYHDADIIKIVATPDGYKLGNILAEFTPKEFYNIVLN